MNSIKKTNTRATGICLAFVVVNKVINLKGFEEIQKYMDSIVIPNTYINSCKFSVKISCYNF